MRLSYYSTRMLFALCLLICACGSEPGKDPGPGPGDPDPGDPPAVPENTGAQFGGPGALGWAVPVANALNATLSEVLVDADKNVHGVGAFEKQAQFYLMDSPGGAYNFTANNDVPGPILQVGDHQFFYAKYDPAGSQVWTVPLAQTGSLAFVTDFELTSGGDIVICGEFGQRIEFPNGTVFKTVAGRSGFLARFTENGALVWARRMGSERQYVTCSGLAIDGNDNIYVAGGLRDDVTFAPYDPARTETAGTVVMEGTKKGLLMKGGGTALNAFLLKYDPDGVVKWGRKVNGTEHSKGGDVTIAADGDPIFTGEFKGSVTIAPTRSPKVGSGDPTRDFLRRSSEKGSQDVFLIRYNSSGTVSWARRYGGAQDDAGLKVRALLSSDQIAIAGTYMGNWSSSVAGADLTGVGYRDLFLLITDGEGTPLYSSGFGSAQDDELTGLASNDHIVGVSASLRAQVAFPPNGASSALDATRVPPNGVVSFYSLDANASSTLSWRRRDSLMVRESDNLDGFSSVAISPTPDFYNPSIGYTYQYAMGGYFSGHVEFERRDQLNVLDSDAKGQSDGFVWSRRLWYGPSGRVPAQFDGP